MLTDPVNENDAPITIVRSFMVLTGIIELELDSSNTISPRDWGYKHLFTIFGGGRLFSSSPTGKRYAY